MSASSMSGIVSINCIKAGTVRYDHVGTHRRRTMPRMQTSVNDLRMQRIVSNVVVWALLLLAPAASNADDWWSFQPLRRPPLSAVIVESWPRNAIDRFILAKLEANKLKPSSEADRHTLIRRVHFDLIGLPPR